MAERIGFKFVPTPGQLWAGTLTNALFAGLGAAAVAGALAASTAAAPVALVLAGVFALSHATDVVHDFQALANRDYIATEHGDPLYDAAGQAGGPYGQLALFAAELITGNVAALPPQGTGRFFTSARYVYLPPQLAARCALTPQPTPE
ncbi:MAG: hypothetical protein ACYC41_04315 [Bacillota bacterium]